MYRTVWQYSNSKSPTYGGYQYDSAFEAGIAKQLDNDETVESFERQKPLRLVVNGIYICTYKIDFLVKYKDGSLCLLEAKGAETPQWKFKWSLLEAIHDELYPGSEMLLIKMKGRWK